MSEKFDLSRTDKVGLNASVRLGELIKIQVRDVGEKIGSLFGEKGREVGKKIDDETKDVDIVVGI